MSTKYKLNKFLLILPPILYGVMVDRKELGNLALLEEILTKIIELFGAKQKTSTIIIIVNNNKEIVNVYNHKK